MPSVESKLIKAGIRLRRWISPSKVFTLEQMREKFEGLLSKIPIPEVVSVREVKIGEIPCDLIITDEQPKSLVIFIHGGGFALGSKRSHRSLASRIAIYSNCHVLVPEYGLAPERPFPEGLNDIHTVYWKVLEKFPSANLFLAGDSAGCGLIASLMVRIQHHKFIPPSGIIMLCPWLDLSLSGESFLHVEKKDPMLTKKNLQYFAKIYAGNHAINGKLIDPINADFDTFPPVFIQVGEHDILKSDGEKFARRLIGKSSEVDFKEWKSMFHDWQFYYRILPEAKQAISEIGNFIKKYDLNQNSIPVDELLNLE
jgi:acetyl esterase/lipase